MTERYIVRLDVWSDDLGHVVTARVTIPTEKKLIRFLDSLRKDLNCIPDMGIQTEVL